MVVLICVSSFYVLLICVVSDDCSGWSLAVGSQLLLDLLKPAALMFGFFFNSLLTTTTAPIEPNICNYAYCTCISTIYMCLQPAYAHIYMYERDTGCALMRLTHTDFFCAKVPRSPAF